MPIHNSEKYIHKCVDSIINQTYSKWELLLVDDESTDRSSEICKIYAKNDHRIKYYKKDYGGIADTRNAGVELAQGKYLYFVDSDDYCESNLLKNVIEVMEKTQADMCVFGYYRHTKHITTTQVYGNRKITREKAIESLLIDERIGNYLWNKMFCKHLFCNISFPQGEIFEDVSVMYKLILKCKHIVTLDKIMYHYQRRAGSLSYYPKVEQLLFYWKVLVERKQYIDRIYPDKADETKVSLIKGAIYIWNKMSRQCNHYQLHEYSFLIDNIKRNKKLLAETPLRIRIMGYLICRMPYSYAAMVHFLKGRNNG